MCHGIGALESRSRESDRGSRSHRGRPGPECPRAAPGPGASAILNWGVTLTVGRGAEEEGFCLFIDSDTLAANCRRRPGRWSGPAGPVSRHRPGAALGRPLALLPERTPTPGRSRQGEGMIENQFKIHSSG